VIAYGPIGSRPTVLTLGMAAPDRAMRPEDRFRLASLAKPVTAAAVLRLVGEGRITLASPVPEAGPGITVRHLLQHSGGWDRGVTFDPIAEPRALSRIGLRIARSCEDVAARMPPAEFRPGTRYAYSNLGYCRLGQLIERLSGSSYESYVRRFILEPRSAQLAYDGAPTVDHPSDWPSAAYAALGPGGGWTGSAAAYWAFAAGPLDPRVTERPPYAAPGVEYYGLGWRVWPDGALSHFGALPGAYAMVVRSGDRVAVLLFNGRPANDEEASRRLKRATRAIGL
jgi:CubicO group peptidase (beta-lactamase class C family)